MACSMDASVTHLVIKAEEIIKEAWWLFLMALAAGAWVVHPDLLEDSLQVGQLLEEVCRHPHGML